MHGEDLRSRGIPLHQLKEIKGRNCLHDLAKADARFMWSWLIKYNKNDINLFMGGSIGLRGNRGGVNMIMTRRIKWHVRLVNTALRTLYMYDGNILDLLFFPIPIFQFLSHQWMDAFSRIFQTVGYATVGSFSPYQSHYTYSEGRRLIPTGTHSQCQIFHKNEVPGKCDLTFQNICFNWDFLHHM